MGTRSERSTVNSPDGKDCGDGPNEGVEMGEGGGGGGFRRRHRQCNRRIQGGGENVIHSRVRRRFLNRRSFAIMRGRFRREQANQGVQSDAIQRLSSAALRPRQRHASRILHIVATCQQTPGPRTFGHPQGKSALSESAIFAEGVTRRYRNMGLV